MRRDMSSDNSDSVPESVGKIIDSEQVIADIDLGGGDAIFVTPAQTIRYQSRGLLSDELIETYQHDVERIAVSKKRRKANVTLTYGGAETAEFSIPIDQTEEVLSSILTGVLHAMHAIESNETVHHVFRFSELTVVITETRLLKHVGEGVWSTEFESYHYDTVDDLTFEEGLHATTVVLAVARGTERFKTPQQQADVVCDTLTSALTAHWDVESITQYRTHDQMIATTKKITLDQRHLRHKAKLISPLTGLIHLAPLQTVIPPQRRS